MLPTIVSDYCILPKYVTIQPQNARPKLFYRLTFYLSFLCLFLPSLDEVRRFMTALHSSRLVVRFSEIPASARSWQTLSYHVFLGLPLGRLPGTSTSWIWVRVSNSLLRFTCQNKESLFFNTTSTSSILRLHKISQIQTLSARDTPQMQLNIRLSQYSNMLVNLCVRAQVSAA